MVHKCTAVFTTQRQVMVDSSCKTNAHGASADLLVLSSAYAGAMEHT